MAIETLLSKAEKIELEEYKRPKPKNLRETHVPFSGSPLKHPYDIEKIVLLTDPYSSITTYLEFRINDISFVEKLTNIVNIEGEVVTMARVWVKKKSIGISCTPFLVDEIKR